MSTNYIPQKDQQLETWALNFATVLNTSYLGYGLQSSDAVLINDTVNAYSAALLVATTPATRTKDSVAAKNAARNNMLVIVRRYAQNIQTNPAISDEQKATIGITLRKTNKTPIPPPSSLPIIQFVGATPQVHTLRYADTNTPDLRARPFGVVALRLEAFVSAIGAAVPTTPSQVLFVTRLPAAVNFAAGDVGKLATYTGRWQNAKGDLGPISLPVAAVII